MGMKLDASTGKWIDDGNAVLNTDTKPDSCPHCHANRLTSAEVMRLASLPAEEMERALQRSYCAAGFIADDLLTDVQKAETARAKLYRSGMRSLDVKEMVLALDKWLDRTIGKVTQGVDINANVNSTNVHIDLDGTDALVLEGLQAKVERARKQLALTGGTSGGISKTIDNEKA